MIPDFNTDGNLPDGIYTADEKVKRLFIWGSFVSAKESPNDIDVLIIMDNDFHLENMSEDCRDVFNYVRARLKFNMDIFWSKRSIGENVIDLWLDTYQTTKDFKRRGIMEVILNDEQLGKAQQAVLNLQKILLEARKVHSAPEYSAISEPILLEIQQREQEILSYLSKTETQSAVV